MPSLAFDAQHHPAPTHFFCAPPTPAATPSPPLVPGPYISMYTGILRLHATAPGATPPVTPFPPQTFQHPSGQVLPPLSAFPFLTPP